MPLKSTTKRTHYKKKQYKRKQYKKRSLVPIKRNYYFFKRWCSALAPQSAYSAGSYSTASSTYTITTPAGSGTNYYGSAYYFKLSDLPDVADFTTLYDTYKILGVQFNIYPLFSEASTATTGAVNGMGCIIHSIIDNDDNFAPTASETGVGYLRQYSNSYRTNNLLMTKKFSRFIKPRVLVANWDSSAAFATGGSKRQWLDCARADIAHYGFKFIIETYTDSANALKLSFKVECKYYLAFKTPI